MKQLTILAIAMIFAGCSNDNDSCETCTAEFINIETGEVIHQEANCNRTPPQGYAFVKCMGKPEY